MLEAVLGLPMGFKRHVMKDLIVCILFLVIWYIAGQWGFWGFVCALSFFHFGAMIWVSLLIGDI